MELRLYSGTKILFCQSLLETQSRSVLTMSIGGSWRTSCFLTHWRWKRCCVARRCSVARWIPVVEWKLWALLSNLAILSSCLVLSLIYPHCITTYSSIANAGIYKDGCTRHCCCTSWLFQFAALWHIQW